MGMFQAPVLSPRVKDFTNLFGSFLPKVGKEKARLKSNTELWNRHQDIAHQHQVAKETYGEKSPQAIELDDKKKPLSAQILKAHRAENIYTSSDRVLLEQGIRNERVHPIVDGDEPIQEHHIKKFVTNYIGDEESNRRMHGLILDCRDKPILFSQILSMDVEVATDDEDRIIRSECPGDLDKIKSTEPVDLTGRENLRTYWTISANDTVNRAGSVTIDSVSADTPSHLVQITSSPNRDFVKAYGLDVLIAMDDDEFYQTWNDFMAQGRDPVMGFHQKGKGAYKGAVHINPNSVTDRYVTNNVYVPSMMAEYKAQAKGDVYAVSDVVFQQFASTGHGQYVKTVEDPQFAPMNTLS